MTQALLATAVLLLITVQTALKPGFNARKIESIARRYGAASIWIERKAPDFTLALRDGSTFRLAEHIGRDVVVLNFFATWSVPARTALPELQRFADEGARFNKRTVTVVIDANERPDQVDAFLTGLGVRLPAGIDDTGSIAAQFGVDDLPTTIVVGADGRIKLYDTAAFSNAQVALARVVDVEIGRLGLPSRPARAGFMPPPEVSTTPGLSGRALAIAEAMPCPCGCDDRRVVACECRTSKAIKARLRAGVDPSLPDGKVMEMLNKEFCMKGM